ncbi:type II toxin-antitoxin system Phd/YefM family antitoxin [Streptomyces cyaneofuscatus]
MKSITEYELRNRFAEVMDAVAGGESFRISRNGMEVAELRPLREADEFFGTEDRVGPDS